MDEFLNIDFMVHEWVIDFFNPNNKKSRPFNNLYYHVCYCSHRPVINDVILDKTKIVNEILFKKKPLERGEDFLVFRPENETSTDPFEYNSICFVTLGDRIIGSQYLPDSKHISGATHFFKPFKFSIGKII